MTEEKEHQADAAGFDQLEAQGRSISDILARLTADRDRLTAGIRDVEHAAELLATRQDARFAEIRQSLNQAQAELRQAEAEDRGSGEQTGKRAEEALERTGEALRRVQALAAESEANDASTAELLGRLAASWHAMANSVRGVGQRVTEFAARQDAQRDELRQLLRQLEIERRQAEAEARARGEQATKRANDALARGDEGLRRVEALAAVSQARAAATTDLLGRLAVDWDKLIGSVRGIEQRVAVFAASQESEFDALRQSLDQLEVERHRAEAERRVGDEHATASANEALAQGDEALRRIEALAAASQARAARATELLGRLAVDWDTLISSMRGIERHVPVSAAELLPEGRSPEDVQTATVSPSAADIPGEPSLAEPSRAARAEEEPSAVVATDVGVADRRNAVAAWLGVTAPGILLAQALGVLALVAAPWLTMAVYVAPAVKLIAAALLLVQAVTCIFLLRGGGRAAVVAFMTLLTVEALGAGLLLGVDLHPRSPTTAICLAMLVMSVMAGSWRGGLASVLAIAVGVGLATHPGPAGPLFHSAMLELGAALGLGTVIPNAPPLATTAVSFPTMLSVETSYGGSPVFVGASAPLFLPALAIALLAVVIGGGLNVLRARKATAAVASAIVATQRTAEHP
jgi:hypothetical protein